MTEDRFYDTTTFRRWCDCTSFRLWYETGRWRVCECGHASDEHIDHQGTCLGDVEVRRREN